MYSVSDSKLSRYMLAKPRQDSGASIWLPSELSVMIFTAEDLASSLGDYLLPWSLAVHEFCQKLASALTASSTAYSRQHRNSEGAQEQRLEGARADSWV